MWTTESQANYVQRKLALTRAVNAGDPQTIVEVCNEAITSFEALGYPDDWSRWEIARYDALLKFKRNFGRAW